MGRANRLSLLSGGSNTSKQLLGRGPVYGNIPEMARLPCRQDDDAPWINNWDDVLPERQVIGDKVLIRQQLGTPQSALQILLLSDQMMQEFQSPDKYINCTLMMGYTIHNFMQDIIDGLIEVNYEYVILYMGTLQLARFEAKQLHQDVEDFAQAVHHRSPNTHLVLSGMVPCPVDFPRSDVRCSNFNRALQLAADRLRKERGYNCSAVMVYNEFLNKEYAIKEPTKNFTDELYLTVHGIRILRAAWLRHLGFFPRKAQFSDA